MKTATAPLELRIPPLAVTLLTGGAAWIAAHTFPALHLDSPSIPAIAATLGLLGVGCCLLGVISFPRAHTTVNPLNPSAASALVASGIYRLTRNPMYLGFLFVLLGEIVWLGSPIALVAAPVFAVYLNRFQIIPEERALQERFGPEFPAYTTRVPRWL